MKGPGPRSMAGTNFFEILGDFLVLLLNIVSYAQGDSNGRKWEIGPHSSSGLPSGPIEFYGLNYLFGTVEGKFGTLVGQLARPILFSLCGRSAPCSEPSSAVRRWVRVPSRVRSDSRAGWSGSGREAAATKVQAACRPGRRFAALQREWWPHVATGLRRTPYRCGRRERLGSARR